MKLGFTGTQQGMTEQQKLQVASILRELKPSSVAHGDCIGADAQFHSLVMAYINETRQAVAITIHPGYPKGDPSNHSRRAHCQLELTSPYVDHVSMKIECPKLFLDRNQDIVDGCDTLLAAPKHLKEQLHSGTWATVRRARKASKNIIFANP